MQTYMCIPRLVLKKAVLDREIYVISISSDLRGDSNHRPPAVGSNNETLDDVTPAIEAAMKLVVMGVSNIFYHVDKGQPVSLSGDGIIVYPPFDPQGMLGLHVAVVESDKKARDFGKLLADLFGRESVKSLLKAISTATTAAGPVPTVLLTSLMGAVVEALPVVLQKNKDDILFSHNHSGIAFNNYNGTPDGRKFTVGNKHVEMDLMVYAAPGA